MDIASSAVTSANHINSEYQTKVMAEATALGFTPTQLTALQTALTNNQLLPETLEPAIQSKVDSAPTDVQATAQSEVDKEASTSIPVKNSTVNGRYSEVIKEVRNIAVVSTPKDIPDNNNSFEEQHPNTFGTKDLAGNYKKYNLITELFQMGLRNGLMVRSDKTGNTTIFIPANTKVNIGQSLNINSKSMDLIMNGKGHFEATEQITIKAPSIKLIGAVDIVGPQTNTATITATGNITSNSKVIGKVNGIFGGISSATHKHTEHDGPSTSAPQ